MDEAAQEASAKVQAFYESYWARVRQDLWGEAADEVAPALVGRFEHHVTFCPDGVLALLRRDSSASYVYAETSQGVIDLARDTINSKAVWKELEVGSLGPGQLDSLHFDLDVACRPEEVETAHLPFDRLQLRFVPPAMDPEFWTTDNGVRLAKQNLDGTAL